MAQLVEQLEEEFSFEVLLVTPCRQETEEEQERPVSAGDVEAYVGFEGRERDEGQSEEDVVVGVLKHGGSLVEEGEEVSQVGALANERSGGESSDLAPFT